MASKTKVKLTFVEYTKEDLQSLEPEELGGLLRERVHHNIEVPLYPTLMRGKAQPIEGFGLQAQLVFDVWQERGLPEDTPDIEWAKRYLDIAAKIRAGETVLLDEPLPTPFTDEEMATVHKLIYGRRSIRDWLDKEVPDEMVDQILDAGGFQRDEVYVANILKCRPPKNRDPEPAEIAACTPYLEQQIDLVELRAGILEA